MLTKVNIEDKLFSARQKRISETEILKEVHGIFKKNQEQRLKISEALRTANTYSINHFDFDKLDSMRIYHLNDIEKLCVEYRLRFLDSRYFKGAYPDEAISAIRALESEHNTTVKNCKIVAPAKLLKLENADDPLLLAPMGNDYYYLIYKWGNDLHPLRKWLMWPYKNFKNLMISVVLVSILLTSLMPMDLFVSARSEQEYALLFLFVFKGIAGTVLFYGFAKGKNFNNAIWRSKYYNA